MNNEDNQQTITEVKEAVINETPNNNSTSIKQPKEKGKASKVLMTTLLLIGCGASGYVGGMIQDSISNQGKVIVNQVDKTQSNIAANVSTKQDFSVQNIAAQCGPSVVEIKTEQVQSGYGWLNNYVLDGAGSGVIMSEDGYILTNAHVVDGATTITVTTSDGQSYPATLIGSDAQSDVAVIKIEGDNFTSAIIGTSSTLVVGEPVVAIGNPLGSLGGSVTDGIISAVTRSVTIDHNTMNVIQTNAAISPGNSGGGLFNAAGELIGIVNAKSSSENAEGIGFALPIDDVMAIATDLINVGFVTNRPALGVTLQTVSYLDGSSSLIVSGFATNSKAQEAGLEIGDVILGADETKISSFADLRSVIKSKKIGDSIVLTVVRDNNLVNISVPLVEMTNEPIPTSTPETITHNVQ